MKKILITGANGFVGINVCEYFLKKKWKVFGLTEKGDVPENIQPVIVDLTDFEKLKKIIQEIKPDVVLHIGAFVVLDRSFEVAQKCIDVNIKGTLNLLESLKNTKLKRFIYFSTEDIYGKNEVPYNENQIPLPSSPYSISKIAGENFCLLYYRIFNIPAVILRVATLFGPNQSKNRFIAGIIKSALANEPILLNSGKTKRDYLFIEELIDALDKIIQNRKTNGEIFNIGHQNSISGYELAKKIKKISRSTSRIILDSFPDRKGESRLWSMDNSKAKKIIGWKSTKYIDDYLKKTVDSYKK